MCDRAGDGGFFWAAPVLSWPPSGAAERTAGIGTVDDADAVGGSEIPFIDAADELDGKGMPVTGAFIDDDTEIDAMGMPVTGAVFDADAEGRGMAVTGAFIDEDDEADGRGMAATGAFIDEDDEADGWGKLFSVAEDRADEAGAAPTTPPRSRLARSVASYSRHFNRNESGSMGTSNCKPTPAFRPMALA